jgi:hypothetical protein
LKVRTREHHIRATSPTSRGTTSNTCPHPSDTPPAAPADRAPIESLAELKEAVRLAEGLAVGTARDKFIELREEHKALTRSWAKASDDMPAVLKEDIEKLESEMREWEPRTLPVSERFKALHAAEAERRAGGGRAGREGQGRG